VTTVLATPAQSAVGRMVVLVAEVKALHDGSHASESSVAFYDGLILLGSVPVQDGRATFRVSRLAIGSHAIRAVYSGSGLYTQSEDVTDVVVSAAPSGLVRASGSNGYGQFGTGTFGFSPVPQVVASLPDVIALSAGFQHSVALRSNGTVWTWGTGQYGQLGTGMTQSPVPVQVPGLQNIIAIASGELHVLALRNDGRVFTWG
jgi:hypothetical protein